MKAHRTERSRRRVLIIDLPDEVLCHICSKLVSQSGTGGLESNEDFRLRDLWDKRPGSCWSLGPLRLVCRGLRTAAGLAVTSLRLKLADISTRELQQLLQVYPRLSHIRVEVREAAPGEMQGLVDNLALVRTLPSVKELALLLPQSSNIYGDVVCPPALLQDLPSMTGLSTLWWCKTPSVPELQAMQQLPNLRCLQLSGFTPSDLHALARLTSFTFWKASLLNISDVRPVLQLTRLEKLGVRGRSVSRNLFRKILTELPRLNYVDWFVRYSPDLDASAPAVGPGTVAVSLTRLTCSPVDGQARGPLQSLSFPLLQHLEAIRVVFDRSPGADIKNSLAWFRDMGRRAPSLTSLRLVPPNSNGQARVVNVRAGISLLTNLISLHLVLRASYDGYSVIRAFVGAEPLACLTRLTRLWVDGVVDPRFFDREVAALSKLTALRELLLSEMDFRLSAIHTPSQEDGLITREAVGSLIAALPNLCEFAVIGGWMDLGRPGWAVSRVTPEGRIVVQAQPSLYGQEEDVNETDIRMENLKRVFGDWVGDEAPYVMLDVLRALHVQDAECWPSNRGLHV